MTQVGAPPTAGPVQSPVEGPVQSLVEGPVQSLVEGPVQSLVEGHPCRAVVGVVSDTHAPRFWKGMPERVAEVLADVDVVLHAGDVCEPSVLDELSALAPVHVVRGNNDGDDVAAWGAPERLEVELAGVRLAMVHDSGSKDGRARRLHRWFPEADVVVFGHSHIPWDETGVDGQRLLNPGSPTDKRRQPHGTVGRLVLADGRVESWTLVEVG